MDYMMTVIIATVRKELALLRYSIRMKYFAEAIAKVISSTETIHEI
jgi:hypothetical protein